jgi:hypothetical protein
MFTSAPIWMFWLANLILGNNGKLLHMIWWRFTQGAAIFPIAGMAILYWVESSYGFAVPVANSWCGNDTCSNTNWNTAMTAQVTGKAGWATGGNLGVPDHLYLMYKNLHPLYTADLNNPWLYAFSNYAADTHGN